MAKNAKKATAVRGEPSQRKTSAARIIAGLLLLILLLGLLGGGIYFILDRTNGGTEDFRAFAVTMDGEEIRSTKSKRSLLRGPHTVSVKYLFDFLTDETFDYDVDIVPKAGVKFDYTVDGAGFPWSDQKDLAKAFALKKEADKFTFTVPDNLAAVLAALYPGQTVEAPQESALQDTYIYTLTVTSYNGAVNYTIDFSIAVKIDGVEVDKPEVQFP